MVSLRDTILLQDSFPSWSEPIHHQATLPDILHSEIPYQSINLMIIIHIFCYNCCILIFLLSLLHSPFHLSFSIRTPCFRAPFTIFQLQTNCQYIHNVPSAPYQTSPLSAIYRCVTRSCNKAIRENLYHRKFSGIPRLSKYSCRYFSRSSSVGAVLYLLYNSRLTIVSNFLSNPCRIISSLS